MRDSPTRVIVLRGLDAAERRARLVHEWLVTDGFGGYASGRIGGVVTRRYHGFLVAALPSPYGRRMLLPHVGERVRLPDGRLDDSARGARSPRGARPRRAGSGARLPIICAAASS